MFAVLKELGYISNLKKQQQSNGFDLAMARIKISKRRNNNCGSVYLFRGKYVLQYLDPVNGKRKIKTLTAPGANDMPSPITKREQAEAAAADFLNDIQKISSIETRAELMMKVAESKSIINRSRLKLSQIWAAFENNQERPDSGVNTLSYYHSYLNIFTAWLKKYQPKVIDVSMIDSAIAAGFMTHIWNTGISEATYNRYRQGLRLIFRVITKADNAENPFANIAKKTENVQSRQDFTPAQVEDIFRLLSDNSDSHMLHKAQMRTMVNLCCWTGCRMQDAAQMRWQAVNFDSNSITYKPLKTARTSGRTVTIPMHPQLKEALQEAITWRESQDKTAFIMPAVATRYQTNASGIGNDISRLIEAIGLSARTEAADNVRRKKRLTTQINPKTGKKETIEIQQRVCQYGVHSFRHSFVSFCANAGVPMAIVQEIVGHGSPAMTRHYFHLDQVAAQKAINTLPQIGSGGFNTVKLADPEATRTWIQDFVLNASSAELLQLQAVVTRLEHDRQEILRRSGAVSEKSNTQAIAAPGKLEATPERLQDLLELYSLETIGQIFGVTGVAIKKRVMKYGITRPSGRIQSGKLSEDELKSIRESLLKKRNATQSFP